MNNKTLAIDLDGTLIKHRKYAEGDYNFELNEGAKEAMDRLNEEGYKIIIFTTRMNRGFSDWQQQFMQIAKFLDKHNIRYEEITAEKPIALAFVDDRAIRFTSWSDILNYFVQ